MYFDAAEADVDVDVEEVMAMAVVRGRREVVQQHWLEEASISLVVVVLVVEKCPTDYGAAIEDLVSESSRSRERRRPRPMFRCGGGGGGGAFRGRVRFEVEFCAVVADGLDQRLI